MAAKKRARKKKTTTTRRKPANPLTLKVDVKKGDPVGGGHYAWIVKVAGKSGIATLGTVGAPNETTARKRAAAYIRARL